MFIIKEYELKFGENNLDIILGSKVLSFGPGLKINMLIPNMGRAVTCSLLVLPNGAKVHGTYMHLGSATTEDGKLAIHLFEVPTPPNNDEPEYTTTLDDDFPPAS